ncbi:MAG: recombination mediator RecR [Chloroflexi bacterium]|nr:recombination mediator RecR [Chloroflexota bacterium]MCI0577161.1 recombination mediator RecR [Chloroflexota bacterium]MCI0649900.1 recombination mediator RecR [Chloroflexota bacterium]MCI0725670.1 recombination mediator RecR [Chloroflexota bacterium]
MASNVLPRPVQRLINEFARLPGVGPKTAARLAFYLLRAADEQSLALAEALQELKAQTQLCSVCFNITEADPCPICADDGRNASLLCVVEEPLDVVAIERSRAYNGRYHVLHGAISPVEGIGPDDLKIAELLSRLERGGFDEVIIATNATLEGDSTALYLQRRLASLNLKLTRLARGLPVGGDLEYTDEITLGRALEGRQELH